MELHRERVSRSCIGDPRWYALPDAMLPTEQRERAAAIVGAIVALLALVLGVLGGTWRKGDDR